MNLDTISNVCILNPKKAELKKVNENLEVSFLSMSSVGSDGSINLNETRILKDVLKGFTYFKEGDVLFAKITPCMENGKGGVAKGLMNGIGFGSTEFHVLRPKNGINGEYIYYLLKNRSFRQQAELKMTGSAGQKRVPITFFQKALIPIPLPTQQNQIVDILNAADELIANDKKLIAKHNELSQSLFMDMFGEYFKLESCKQPIGSIAKFIDYRGKTPKRVSDGIPLISAKCVRSGYFDKNRLDFISKETFEKVMVRGFPKPDDVLFTTEGATMGFTCRIPEGLGDFAVGQRLITLQTYENYNSVILDFMLNHDYMQNEIFKRATGSAAKGIRSAVFAKINIPTPPIDKQNKFAERIKSIEKQKKQAQESLVKSEELLNCLMQKAFKGELVA